MKRCFYFPIQRLSLKLKSTYKSQMWYLISVSKITVHAGFAIILIIQIYIKTYRTWFNYKEDRIDVAA